MNNLVLVRTAKLKLRLAPEEAAQVREATLAFRDALNYTSAVAFENGKTQNKIQTLVYSDVRQWFGLPAQLSINVCRTRPLGAAILCLWQHGAPPLPLRLCQIGDGGASVRTPTLHRHLQFLNRLFVRGLLTCVLLLGACSQARSAQSADEPAVVAPLAEVSIDSVAPIRTDRLRYALHGDDRHAWVSVLARYRNPHPRTVYLADCGAGFERLRGCEWQPASDDRVCPTVDRPPTPIRPGAEHRDRHGMFWNMGRWWSPSWDSLPGTYRLVYRLSFDPEVEGTSERNPALLPKAARVSNVFEVLPLLSDLPITLPPPPPP